MVRHAACFGINFCTVYTFYCLDDIKQVWVAEWPPFGKELLTRFTVCSLCIMYIFDFEVSHSGFDFGALFLIALVSGHCLLLFKMFYYYNCKTEGSLDISQGILTRFNK